MARHDHLISTLFKDEADRQLARAFAAKFDAEPMMADRIEPLRTAGPDVESHDFH